MSRGIPGGKRRLKFFKTSKRCRVCLFHQNVTTKIISFCKMDSPRIDKSLLLAMRSSKMTMTTSPLLPPPSIALSH